MTEQIKIMDMINKWGYLNLEQIALLLNKNIYTIQTHLTRLIKKKLISANKLTRKNIYVLSSSGNYYLGRKAHQIKINFNELPHQDMLIKWLVVQTDIVHYQTERELKMENGNLKGYPDLLIETTDNKNILIECERTRKAKTRYKAIFDSVVSYLKQDYECWWIVPNQAMAKFINERIKEDNWRIEQHKVILFNYIV
ncbi:hypothetical protein D6D54_07530 [Spiroplasma poulsonii]|uniref:Uncharacterized protein n=1 Tax=Spiroplasma poulsonii TaxID=2138 RepID=A0A433ENJ9_9MOLU|nr:MULTISPECIES: BlaI/MecI/CopY family transcriptional regulator [Spiroplasma]MBH8623306.1 hypothetical protein [Spiroplasma sp. hyd1]MBW3059331.1 hypothetical protein [Spiroplasma poulsonii]RUP75881.1 hypothetical protein D6D54_07530 [Spiroplasma poulsonii]